LSSAARLTDLCGPPVAALVRRIDREAATMCPLAVRFLRGLEPRLRVRIIIIIIIAADAMMR